MAQARIIGEFDDLPLLGSQRREGSLDEAPQLSRGATLFGPGGQRRQARRCLKWLLSFPPWAS